MSTPSPILYKLFIIYAKSDKAWVNGHLIPELNIPKDQLLTNQRLPLGMSRAEAYEYAITHSTYTLMVLTPSFLDDAWSEFAPDMASYLGVKEQRTRLIPSICNPAIRPYASSFWLASVASIPTIGPRRSTVCVRPRGFAEPGIGGTPRRQQMRQVAPLALPASADGEWELLSRSPAPVGVDDPRRHPALWPPPDLGADFANVARSYGRL